MEALSLAFFGNQRVFLGQHCWTGWFTHMDPSRYWSYIAAGGNTSYYVRVIEKLAASANHWITKEARCLNNALEKNAYRQEKPDEIMLRANARAAFLEEKKE
ncbi:hypothetical protein FRC07_013819 [Ceratobasidium sp. 392]|nr:hypothetical protein FRC07_013819 [Ceratobasidium sp. 392]